MYDNIEFPQPVCIETKPHGPHRIEGTWRDHCPGIDAPNPVAPSQQATEQRTCPKCGAQPGEECRWPDGGTCAERLTAHMTAEERDAHSSTYWEQATQGQPRQPAFEPEEEDPFDAWDQKGRGIVW